MSALILLVSACAGEYSQSSIDPKSDFAETIQGLYLTVFIWTMIILVVVWGLLAFVLVRFRQRPDSPTPKQTHGDLGMEIAWTVGPAIIVVAIAIPTVQAVFETQQGDPETSMVVEVIGHQYWWEFRYPDQNLITANELHLPVGEPISLRIHSADVIHSFWVPQLGGKRDANPLIARPEGLSPHYEWLHFTITEPGVYLGQCAEFCGMSHSLMGMRVVAESSADFEAWAEEWRSSGTTPDDGAPDAAPVGTQQALAELGLDSAVVEQGRAIFHGQTCVACHTIEGTNAAGVLGPNLTALGLRAEIAAGWLQNSVENLERWIAAPHSVKPGVLMPGVDLAGGGWPATALDPEQVRAVAQYLFSLR